MSSPAAAGPEPTIVAAVAALHDRGWEGVRIAANFYATGHWRCRVYVPEPGEEASERNILLSYTNGLGWDIFQDGRTQWAAATIADRLETATRTFPLAARRDPAYRMWLAELRRRTRGGYFVMYEDAYTPEQMWDRRGLVKLLYADRAAADADAATHGGVDANGWSLVGTMPAPPAS